MFKFALFVAIAIITTQSSRNKRRERRRGWATTTTQPPAPPESDCTIPVYHLRDGLWIAQSPSYNLFFLCTGRGVVVVDYPPPFGDCLIPSIRAACPGEEVETVIYSHHHKDHIGNAGLFKTAKKFICQKLTPNPPPDCTHTFTDKKRLKFYNQTLLLEYRGPAHSRGNTFVYAPRQKVLLFIDVVAANYNPNLQFAEEFVAFKNSMDWILSYDFDYYVGGHRDSLATRADVEKIKAYMADLVAAAAVGYEQVEFQEVQARVGGTDVFLAISTFFREIAQVCQGIMASKYPNLRDPSIIVENCVAAAKALFVE